MSANDLSGTILAMDWADPVLIARLSAWMEAAGVFELSLEAAPDRKLVIRHAPEAIAAPDSPSVHHAVKAPFFGRFHAVDPASASTDPVAVGQPVTAGALLGVLVAGLVRIGVRAPCEGLVSAVHASEGQMVGYGDLLISLEEAS